jgi:hypothetical protein
VDLAPSAPVVVDLFFRAGVRHWNYSNMESNGEMKSQGTRQQLVVGMKYRWLLMPLIVSCLTACGNSTTTTVSRRQAEEPRGFFGNLMDQMTERECNVGKFICPYGLGPAGEPCTCTDPSGIVLNGRTVK